MRASFKTDRLVLIALGLLLAAAAVVYYLLRHAQELNLNVEAGRLLLTVLAIVMALLVIALLFLLLRNLIKLLVERRRHVLGSRFRTKLVFIFVVLVFLPSVAMFYFAVDLIRRANENLFTEPLDQIAGESREIVDAYNQLMRQDCARFASQMAGEIASRRLLDPERAVELSRSAKSWLARNGLELVVIYGRGREEPALVLVRPRESGKGSIPDAEMVWLQERQRQESEGEESPNAPGPPRNRIENLARRAIDSGQASDELDRISPVARRSETPDQHGPAWQRASGVAPILSASPFGDVEGAVVAGRYVNPETAERTDRIDRAINTYRQNVRNRPNLKRVWILVFAILALTVVFAATWTGFYLARQITVPIQALAEGTQAITSGDLDHRVTAQAGDEIGFLIESFNRMTEELAASRKAIEMSRRQIEISYQQLEERRQYIEQLLENVPAGVISLDARGRISTMNPAACRILGLDASLPASGLLPCEVLHREELAPLLHEIEGLPRGEGPSHVQDFELSIGGRPVHLAANSSARYDGEGRFQSALIVLEDLTPLIRAQRTAAWREVARRMAHEIKNPLTPIQLSAQRILKKFQEGAGEFPRIVEDGVHTIVQEVSTLKSLVDEFSRFAQMPAVSLVPTNPNTVIEAALSLYDGIHPGVDLVKDLESPLPDVPLDGAQIKRVLINLIDNAIAAMDGRGRIDLRSLSLPAERRVRIEVSDNGPGIDPGNKERLFVPYFSTKKRGTGLGLAIVNRIVSDHNGFIRVEDNPPRGTRFVIDLPVA